MNEQNSCYGVDQGTIDRPNLSLQDATISFLAKIFLDGGADTPTFENGSSDKISARLSSGHDGFFDETKFPRAV